MSPLEIDILLHYWTRPGDYRAGDLSAPAVADAVARFVEHGILRQSQKDGQRFEGNEEALELYAEAICAVPLPVHRWTMP